MKFCGALFALGLATLLPAAAEVSTRFSQTLSPQERHDSGIARFTSDQAAVLDALVRHDAATSSARTEKTPEHFSQRLSVDERRNAGFGVLTAEETARVDALVERYEAAALARALLAPPSMISRGRVVTPTETKPPGREIHGTFSLSYGWGQGGYSEKTGSMVLRMDDPEHHFSVTVGYAESQVKGGDSYYYRPDAPLPAAP
ncbi:MAG TPA: hypothetical protein VHD62_10295 [Opitutaceae bacterium]|nr:hypothetical protein [Opitutaceae bacterium]